MLELLGVTSHEPSRMRYVYILRSLRAPGQSYVGVTGDLRRRLRDHNAGRSEYTKQFRPWGLETYIAFSDYEKAGEFERYLKHGSGHAFLKRHF